MAEEGQMKKSTCWDPRRSAELDWILWEIET